MCLRTVSGNATKWGIALFFQSVIRRKLNTLFDIKSYRSIYRGTERSICFLPSTYAIPVTRYQLGADGTGRPTVQHVLLPGDSAM